MGKLRMEERELKALLKATTEEPPRDFTLQVMRHIQSEAVSRQLASRVLGRQKARRIFWVLAGTLLVNCGLLIVSLRPAAITVWESELMMSNWLNQARLDAVTRSGTVIGMVSVAVAVWYLVYQEGKKYALLN